MIARYLELRRGRRRAYRARLASHDALDVARLLARWAAQLDARHPDQAARLYRAALDQEGRARALWHRAAQLAAAA